MFLPRLHLSGNVAQVISRIPGEFRQAKQVAAVGVEGFAGCKLEQVSGAPHRGGRLPGKDVRAFG